MPYAPDLPLVNANVRTMDPFRPRAAAVAVAGGRIVRVGDDAAAMADGTDPGSVIDLRGATLIPGFHDAHNHMIGFGLSLSEVDLRAGTLDEIYARVAARAAETPAGEWIIGSGYDQTKPFNAGEAVTAQEALRAYTWGSAYASKAELVKGSIEVGKLADLTVLSEDPVEVSPDRIAGLAVIATIVDGQLRYNALD